MANPVTPGIAADHSEAAHLHQRANQGTWNNNCTCLLQGTKQVNAITGGGWTWSEFAIGRDWLAQLKLDWQELYQVNQSEHTLQTILDKHKAVFKDELGEAVRITAKLHVSTNTKPYFCRARPQRRTPAVTRPKSH